MPQLQQVNVPRRQRRASNRGIAAIGAGITRATERQERGQAQADAAKASALQEKQRRKERAEDALAKVTAAQQSEAAKFILELTRANNRRIETAEKQLVELELKDDERQAVIQNIKELKAENAGLMNSSGLDAATGQRVVGGEGPRGGFSNQQIESVFQTPEGENPLQDFLQSRPGGPLGGGQQQQGTPGQEAAARQTLANIPKVIDRTVKPEKQPEAYRAYFNTHRQLVGGADLTDTEFANLLVAPAIGKRPIGPNVTDKVVKNRIKRENELALGLKRVSASQRKNPNQMVDALGPILENAQVPFNPLAADTKVNTKGLKTRAEWVDRIVALRDTDRTAAEALLVKFKAKFGE